MEDYKNGFEIAIGLTSTPLRTLKDIRCDEELKKNRILMSLVKQMLAGFRKWMRIAYLSAVKGLNPFGSDKKAVECGYYDYRKTEEFKHLREMVAHHLGLNKAYLRDDVLEKYKVVSAMYAEKGLDISKLSLTEEGFFYDSATERSITVITSEQYQKLSDFAKSNPKYAEERFVWYKLQSGEVVVSADSVAVRAFLEKEGLGRELRSRDDRKIETDADVSVDFEGNQVIREATEHVKPGQKFTDGEYEYTYTTECDVTIDKYVGNSDVVHLPEGVVVNGTMQPVSDLMAGIFAGTPVKEVHLNALYWNEAMYNPSCFVTGPESFPVMKWENLTPEQEAQLDANRQWAATIPRDELGLPLEVESKETEMEKENPEQEEQHPQKEKPKDRGIDI